MSAKFTVDGNNTKIIFEYTAPTVMIQEILGDASHYLWKNEEENPFSEATNQEKLDVLDAHVKQVILDLANTFKSLKAQNEARETEKENEYQL